jgi:hypothetical protein
MAMQDWDYGAIKQEELDDAGIALTPAQYAQASVSTWCVVGLFVMALVIAIFHEKPVDPPIVDAVTQVPVEK